MTAYIISPGRKQSVKFAASSMTSGNISDTVKKGHAE